MQESSFFKLFSLLEKKEVRLFQKYMACMYEDQKTALLVLDFFISQPKKAVLNKRMTMERAYLKIFDRHIDEDQNGRKNFLNTLSDLHLWLKGFLMNEMLRKDKFSRDLVWILTVMEDKRLSEENIKVRKLKLQVNKGQRTDSFDYLKGMVSNYLLLQRGKPGLDINVLQQYSQDLDGYYLLLKVRAACEIANTQNLNPQQFREILPDPLISMIQMAPVVQQPLLRIYLEVYQLLVHKTDEIYDNIANQLVFFYNQFPAEATHDILKYLRNFASNKTKEGVEVYWSKTHELNKLALRNTPDIPSGVLSPAQYLNIISAAVQGNDFVWAENFMNQKSAVLPAEEKHVIMLLAKAIIYFGKRDFKTAKELLLNSKFEDPINEIRAKTYLLMVDYELSNDPYELLADCIKFETYLMRHEVDYQKIISPFRSFSKTLKMLIKCREPQERLFKILREDNQVASRHWLMKKVSVYRQQFFKKVK